MNEYADKARRFRKWVPEHYKDWWTNPDVCQEAILAYITTHMERYVRPTSIRASINAIAWSGAVRSGYSHDWRLEWPALSTTMQIYETTYEAAASAGGKEPVPGGYITTWAMHMHLRLQDLSSKYGTENMGRWPHKVCVAFDNEYKYLSAALFSRDTGVRGGESMAGKTTLNPTLRHRSDNMLVGPALLLTDIVYKGAHGEHMQSTVLCLRGSKGGPGAVNVIYCDRNDDPWNDAMCVLAHRFGFERSPGGVKHLLEFAQQQAAHRIPVIPMYFKPQQYRKAERHMNTKSLKRFCHIRQGTFNKNLQKYLVAVARKYPYADMKIAICNQASSHSLRKEFIFTRFKATLGRPNSVSEQTTLATRVRWRKMDLMRLYATYKASQMLELMEWIDKVERKR